MPATRVTYCSSCASIAESVVLVIVADVPENLMKDRVGIRRGALRKASLGQSMMLLFHWSTYSVSHGRWCPIGLRLLCDRG